MANLATKADLVARLGRDVTCEEDARLEALLADASALVRAYTGRDFEQTTDDVVILRGQGGTIRLPQRPVTKVSLVQAIGAAGTPDITLVDWIFDGIDTIRVGEGNYVINLPAIWWDDDGYPGTYRVTYSHGYATPPPDVVMVVCSMVLRTITAPTMVGGLTSESIGPYSYRLESAGVGTAVSLGDMERKALARYRRTTGMISTRVG